MNEILDNYQKAKTALSSSIKEDLHGYFLPLFEKHPELESFSWTQYAPYFNDGDACMFSSNGIDRVNDIDHDDGYEEWKKQVESGYGKTRVLGPLGAAYTAAEELKATLDDDVLETLLGEGRATVTKKKITMEECRHD